jgi:tripartite-type tricarboxylate transporter receptor subunit TctC
MIKACMIVAAMALASVPVAFAQDSWPTHPIRFIVPFAPGGGTDGQCRVLADAAGKRLGQAIIVENLAGAGGTIGFNMVARADPDGYTILSATPGFATNPFIQKDIAYDPERDFASVIHATTSPVILVVAADSPIHSVRDLLDTARANPGQIRYGSAGIGSIAHLSGALLGALGGVKFTHVPYRGSEPAMIDLMAGRLQIGVENATSVLPRIRNGQLRAIAVGTTSKSDLVPEAPTIAETVPGYESSSWLGVLVPAKTPRPIVDRLNTAFNDSLNDPEVRRLLSAFGVEIVGGPPEVFGVFLKVKLAELKTVARAANLTPQ